MSKALANRLKQLETRLFSKQTYPALVLNMAGSEFDKIEIDGLFLVRLGVETPDCFAQRAIEFYVARYSQRPFVINILAAEADGDIVSAMTG